MATLRFWKVTWMERGKLHVRSGFTAEYDALILARTIQARPNTRDVLCTMYEEMGRLDPLLEGKAHGQFD